MPRRRIDWFGPRLRRAREDNGISQADLARAVELEPSQINKLETGVNQPTFAVAHALAEALGISVAEFAPTDKAPASKPKRPGKR